MQWSYKARELMQNQCLGFRTGKIYKIISTGEKRRLWRKRETLEKKDTDQNRDGEKRNNQYYGVGRFLPPFQKSPVNDFSRLFLNILRTYFPKPYFSLFSLIKTLSLFPNPIFPEWKGLCFIIRFRIEYFRIRFFSRTSFPPKIRRRSDK